MFFDSPLSSCIIGQTSNVGLLVHTSVELLYLSSKALFSFSTLREYKLGTQGFCQELGSLDSCFAAQFWTGVILGLYVCTGVLCRTFWGALE
ncbi:hypothetical protein BDZ91DRAFT_728735 [Kalaharituber pfeilii]|nr:hypothetical protein BDZ91DRAFT_728735 [Kalaharituber pfeilii]